MLEGSSRKMGDELSADDLDLWQQVVSAEDASMGARTRLFSHPSSIVPLVKRGLHQPAERTTALRIAAMLSAQQKRELLPDLVALASFVHGSTKQAQDIIMSLRRDWLRDNIERYAESILKRDDYEEYASLLELYTRIDRDLVLRLAQHAAQHDDPDIRDVGKGFLADLERSAQREQTYPTMRTYPAMRG